MSKWRIMPYVIVRRAGFPINWLESLRFTETLACVKNVLEIEKRLDEQRLAIVRLIEHLVVREKNGQDRRHLLSTMSKIRKGLAKRKTLQCPAIPVEEEGYDQLGREVAAWNDLLQQAAEQQRAGRECAESEMKEKRARLRQLLHSPRLREALWSMNPRFDEAVTRYLENPRGERTSDDKRFERRLITYLQRLCAKNETNSFFGPIDYAKPNPEQQAPVVYEWAVPFVRERRVFCSYWAAETLLEKICSEPGATPFLRPRRHTLYSRVNDHVLRSGLSGRETTLSALAAAVYDLADGTLSFREMAERLRQPLDAVLAEGKLLAQQQAIILHPLLPGDEADPIAWILTWLKEQPQSFPQRDGWIANLLRLQEEIRTLEETGWPERKERLRELERMFARLTARDATREAGEMYADRSIVFEDAHGPLAIEIGGTLWAQLEESLQPILEAARADAIQTSRQERQAAARLLDEWSNGRGTMPYLRFLHHRSRIAGEQHLPEPALSSFQRAAAQRFEEGDPSTPICLQAADLDAEGTGQTVGEAEDDLDSYFLSVDLMFIPTDGDDVQIVVGEAHPQFLTAVFPSACFHPERERMMEEIDAWAKRQRAYPHMAQIAYHRKTKIFPYRLPGKVIELLPRLPEIDDQVIPAGELHVSNREGQVYLHDQTGKEWRLYPPLHAEPLDPVALFSHPRLGIGTVKTGNRTPRIVMGRVLLQRARWELDADAWRVEQGSDHPFDLMLHVYRLKEQEGMPDWVFVRVEGERKPFCIDFANVFLLEMLQGLLKQSRTAVFSEMLPAPNDLWLDDGGERYCCEFRTMCLRA
jgi:hypothetical protein